MSEVRLGTLVRRTLGGGTPARAVSSFWQPEIPWASVKDISAGGRDLCSTEEWISRQGLKASASNLIEAGTPIVAMRMAIGAVVTFTKNVAINQDLRALIPAEGIDSRYLYYLLESSSQAFSSLGVGSTVKGIRLTQLLNVPVRAAPALEKQREVADLLSAIDAQIDVVDTQTKKESLRALGLLQAMLPQGFDVSSQPSGRLADALTGIEAGKSFMCSDAPAPVGAWGVLKVSAVRPEGFVSAENKQVENLRLVDPRFEVADGDLLMTRANTPELVGAACYVLGTQRRLLLCDKTLRLRPKPEALSQFLWLWLQTPVARRHVDAHATGTSAGMKNISQAAIRSLPLHMPSLAEQERLIRPIVALSDHIQAMKATSDKLRKLKSGLSATLLSLKTTQGND